MNPQQAYSRREYERQAIDAEIKSLEESILALKRCRNALSPISSLPPEVIAIIFSYSRLSCTSTISSLPTEAIADLFQSCRLPGTPPPHSVHLPQSSNTFHCPSPRVPSSPISVPDTLFSGTTPRLSSLRLRNCDISWKSPLLRGLTCLDVCTKSRPSFADWLKALREMPHLEKLVLHSSSPIGFPLPSTSHIEASVSLLSLRHLDISDTAENCALVLSYLFLPALTRLCATLESANGGNMEDVFLSLSRHAKGPQDIEPLQSVLISRKKRHTNIIAWPLPDIDVDPYDPFALLSVALSARVALSITSNRHSPDQYSLLDRAIAALPLGSILTLTAQHRSCLDDQFWLRNAPKWHLLQRAKLGLSEARGFIKMLSEDNGGREYPLLPSLTTLVLLDISLSGRRTRRLCDALMKRVEQGVPLETLDLFTCYATTFTVQLLSEIVVDVLAPIGKPFGVRGPFVPEDSDNSELEDYLYDHGEDDLYDYGEEWGDGEIYV
ncbi:hypothetical protein EI94DRAFT_1754263 [Lactarius quietus]|nr:hypothetical protein EI94DRAFT_1754263 [Lactarius quietus]